MADRDLWDWIAEVEAGLGAALIALHNIKEQLGPRPAAPWEEQEPEPARKAPAKRKKKASKAKPKRKRGDAADQLADDSERARLLSEVDTAIAEASERRTHVASASGS